MASTIEPAAVAVDGARIPTEFTPYWDALERPSVKRARALTRRALGFDLVPPEDRVLEFAHGCYDADPIAEAFVDAGRAPIPRTGAPSSDGGQALTFRGGGVLPAVTT
jgi:hypothetical protein